MKTGEGLNEFLINTQSEDNKNFEEIQEKD